MSFFPLEVNVGNVIFCWQENTAPDTVILHQLALDNTLLLSQDKNIFVTKIFCIYKKIL